MPHDTDLETIKQYAYKKGFVYPSSEIYGGFAATYDFGPLGTQLKHNLENLWRRWNVIARTDMEEIEGAIFTHPRVWEASGHVGGFSDLLVEDKVTHQRHRADHLIEDAGILDNAGHLSPEEANQMISEHNLTSPEGNALSEVKNFNLLVKTHLGSTEDESNVAYLKGESCQNIYLNWKKVQADRSRKLPFGIAQKGKAFRNEITVKQFLFRTREFEQVDVQYFCRPEEADDLYEDWKDNQKRFLTEGLGFSDAHVKLRQHDEDERAFYATDAWDVEYQYGELGFKEVEGVHNRGTYDLDQHSSYSGEDLTYLDQHSGERFHPAIIESSAGLNRLFLACLFEFYAEERLTNSKGEEETRVVLTFPYELAPFQVAVLPLLKKDGHPEKAREIYADLRGRGILADYDEVAAIGKRYRRQDEAGTPWCLTVDHQTLEDNTVTLRHRDTMKQVSEDGRISLNQLPSYLTPEAFDTYSST